MRVLEEDPIEKKIFFLKKNSFNSILKSVVQPWAFSFFFLFHSFFLTIRSLLWIGSYLSEDKQIKAFPESLIIFAPWSPAQSQKKKVK